MSNVFFPVSILEKGSFLQNFLVNDVQDVHKLFIETLRAIFVKFHFLSLKSSLKRFFRGFRVFCFGVLLFLIDKSLGPKWTDLFKDGG